jgi:preprotein translocase SecE subunit
LAKTRAQRKAERRRRQAQQERQGQSTAQHRTQVPESADVLEAELAEAGADLDELKEAPQEVALEEAPEARPATPGSSGQSPVGFGPVEVEEEQAAPEAPAPSRADVGVPEAEPRLTRRERRRQERERQARAKESERRRQQRAEPQERQRGAVVGFLVSCWAELKRVQWPDRDTLIQASAVTLLFIAVAGAYLGALDALFNWLIKRVILGG